MWYYITIVFGSKQSSGKFLYMDFAVRLVGHFDLLFHYSHPFHHSGQYHSDSEYILWIVSSSNACGKYVCNTVSAIGNQWRY